MKLNRGSRENVFNQRILLTLALLVCRESNMYFRIACISCLSGRTIDLDDHKVSLRFCNLFNWAGEILHLRTVVSISAFLQHLHLFFNLSYLRWVKNFVGFIDENLDSMGLIFRIHSISHTNNIYVKHV